jgi:aminoglycoside phosphotransferase (APT) family kinase protein
VPVPEVLDLGGDERLSWSLTTAMPGTPLAERCTWPAPAGLRGLIREAAGLLRALHARAVPGELAGLLRGPVTSPDPLRRAGAELVLLPPSAALGLIPAARALPFVDHGVLDAAAARLRDLGDLAGDGDVLLHGDFYLGNILVRDGQVSALIDLEFARLGPPDLELIAVIRALDAEARLGVPRPPLLAWLEADYPGLFGAPDLDRRLWAYAIAYTIRHVIFWPPDRPADGGLDPAHPLHTLRRLAGAPLLR